MVDTTIDQLNPAQRSAVEYGTGPLLIIAGAGSGKTATLAHRVAELIVRGADPRRILLLTFTRRAATEMIRRAQLVLSQKRASIPGGAAGSITWLVNVEDENDQPRYVAEQVLARREAGVQLKHQAVLFRAAHHSDALEIELGRRNIPFVKYGGLRFLEAAHVKDVLGILRWAENPRDSIAAFRSLQLLTGIGPAGASHAWQWVEQHNVDLASLATFQPPGAATTEWLAFADLMIGLGKETNAWPGQIGRVRRWYEPRLEALHGNTSVRAGDLEQLEQIAGSYANRERFLSELTLDPPTTTGNEAGPPLLDEDYLILSTIHSAKGQEWDAVYVLNVVDGCIPSDMATGTAEEIEEERRLLYVAMTRAKHSLHLIRPFRFFTRQQHRHGDRYVTAPHSRFLPEGIRDLFEQVHDRTAGPAGDDSPAMARARVSLDVAAKLRALWNS